MTEFAYNPYGTFNFTQEEFDKASTNTKLRCVCKHCGKEYGIKKHVVERIMDPNDTSNHNTLTSLKYCSKKCQKEDNPDNEMIEVTCAYCGKTYMRPRKVGKGTKSGLVFCSPSCSAKYQAAHDIPRDSGTVIKHTNPNGNFLFTEEDYNKISGPRSSSLKVLPVRCMCCGDIFYVSAAEVRDFYTSTGHQNRLRMCSMKCVGAFNSKTKESQLEKRRATCTEKYGVDSFTKTQEYKEKTQQTNLERYGVVNPRQNKDVNDKIERTRRSKYYDKFIEILKINKHVELLTNKDDYINNIDDLLTYRCMKCGYIWTSDITNPQYVYCEDCCSQPWSNKELELCNKIREFYHGEIRQHVRNLFEGSRKEVDIYIPDKKLAIEFNGNFYHSTAFGYSSNRHVEKTNLYKDQGIRLIHVFEYEWDRDQNKVLDIIKSAVGSFDQVLYARKCEIREVDHDTSSQFLNEYHLQGNINGSIRYGLYYNHELVSLITAGKSRFKENEYELYRYCNKVGIRVVGGFSKLIKYMMKHHLEIKTLISYVDLAHFTGEGYKAVGFKEVGTSKPNYKYYKGTSIYSRMQCQKHKLPALLKEQYDENLSEQQNMENAGYYRIYDCGNMKLEYKSNTY